MQKTNNTTPTQSCPSTQTSAQNRKSCPPRDEFACHDPSMLRRTFGVARQVPAANWVDLDDEGDSTDSLQPWPPDDVLLRAIGALLAQEVGPDTSQLEEPDSETEPARQGTEIARALARKGARRLVDLQNFLGVFHAWTHAVGLATLSLFPHCSHVTCLVTNNHDMRQCRQCLCPEQRPEMISSLEDFCEKTGASRQIMLHVWYIRADCKRPLPRLDSLHLCEKRIARYSSRLCFCSLLSTQVLASAVHTSGFGHRMVNLNVLP